MERRESEPPPTKVGAQEYTDEDALALLCLLGCKTVERWLNGKSVSYVPRPELTLTCYAETTRAVLPSGAFLHAPSVLTALQSRGWCELVQEGTYGIFTETGQRMLNKHRVLVELVGRSGLRAKAPPPKGKHTVTADLLADFFSDSADDTDSDPDEDSDSNNEDAATTPAKEVPMDKQEAPTEPVAQLPDEKAAPTGLYKRVLYLTADEEMAFNEIKAFCQLHGGQPIVLGSPIGTSERLVQRMTRHKLLAADADGRPIAHFNWPIELITIVTIDERGLYKARPEMLTLIRAVEAEYVPPAKHGTAALEAFIVNGKFPVSVKGALQRLIGLGGTMSVGIIWHPPGGRGAEQAVTWPGFEAMYLSREEQLEGTAGSDNASPRVVPDKAPRKRMAEPPPVEPANVPPPKAAIAPPSPDPTPAEDNEDDPDQPGTGDGQAFLFDLGMVNHLREEADALVSQMDARRPKIEELCRAQKADEVRVREILATIKRAGGLLEELQLLHEKMTTLGRRT